MNISNEVFLEFVDHANKKYDGHFTLLKFTTNYKCCFGTLLEINPLTAHLMASGIDATEAMKEAIKNDVNCYEIEEKVEKI